jgi:hypothetical protein
MNIRILRFIGILLAALAMGMHLAHAFELAPKLMWEPSLYIAVQASLYPVFGMVGPFLEVGALLTVSALAWRVRGRPAFGLTLVSAIAILLSLAVWLLFVMPANAHINQWAATQAMPTDWMHWRAQWQYAQAATFVLHLAGLSALLYSVLRETPGG